MLHVLIVRVETPVGSGIRKLVTRSSSLFDTWCTRYSGRILAMTAWSV